MTTSEYLTKWEQPSDYGGHSPNGDYVLGDQTRDCDALTRSNYICTLELLNKGSAKHADPVDGEPWVYDFRQGHWACGWVETIIVRQDAPKAIIELAEEIVCALADYPVLNDDHHSELEESESQDFWESSSISDRIYYIKESGVNDLNIFAARSNSIPCDNEYILSQYMRELHY